MKRYIKASNSANLVKHHATRLTRRDRYTLKDIETVLEYYANLIEDALVASGVPILEGDEIRYERNRRHGYSTMWWEWFGKCNTIYSEHMGRTRAAEAVQVWNQMCKFMHSDFLTEADNSSIEAALTNIIKDAVPEATISDYSYASVHASSSGDTSNFLIQIGVILPDSVIDRNLNN